MSKGHKHYSEEILTLSGFIIKQQSLKINQTSQQNELKVNKAKNIKKEFMKIKKDQLHRKYSNSAFDKSKYESSPPPNQ